MIVDSSYSAVHPKVLNRGLEINVFKLQSRYYLHFRTNTTGKGMSHLIPQPWVKIVPPVFFYKDELGIEKPAKV